MRLYSTHFTLMVILALLALSACNAGTDPDVPLAEKSAIELSAGTDGGEGSVTKSVFTNAKPVMKALPEGTGIRISMRSIYDSSIPYPWAFEGDKAPKYCSTWGGAGAAEDTRNPIIFKADGWDNMRYWDDAHARSSVLSIYALTVPGKATSEWNWNPSERVEDTGLKPWSKSEDDAPTTAYWALSSRQTAESIALEDLCFSNNITDQGTGNDKRLRFDPEKKLFDRNGNMVFYHALARISVKVVMGEGFTDADFKFNEGGNIRLSGFYGAGLFDLQQGEFTSAETRTFDHMAPLVPSLKSDGGEKYYELSAFVLPGTDMVASTESKAMELLINNNRYIVSMATLFDRIPSESKETCLTDGTTIKAGVHYAFTLIIGKSKINNISAQIVDWELVEAETETPSNAYINVNVKTDEGEKVSGEPDFDFLRAAGKTYDGTMDEEGFNAYEDYNWEKGYEVATGMEETATAGVYKSGWMWPDNITFYHFRTLSPKGLTLEDNAGVTYIDIEGGVIKAGETTASDYIWGAPFRIGVTSPDPYSFETGYCNNTDKSKGQIYKAIGASNDNITLIRHHMSAQVFVDLETTTGEDKVELDGASVEIVRLATSARLLVGNGLITEYGGYDAPVLMTPDAHEVNAPVPAYDYSYGVLPQILTHDDATVGIIITTADHNRYIINDISKSKTVGSGSAIRKWEPGRKYFYKYVLKKTGIDRIEVTVVNWYNVIAEEDEVQIQ